MGRLDLLSIKKNNVLLLAFTVIFSFLLPGCNPDAGKIAYEIIYSSGNKIPPEKSLNGRAYPIEDSEIELKWNTNEGKEAVLQLINQDNVVINEYFNLPSSAARGYEGDDGFIWICAEDWKTVHSYGYLDSTLEKSIIMKINPQNGEIMFFGGAGKNELYLGNYGERVYFYSRGIPSQVRLFGIVKTEAQNSGIIYRDADDWDTKQNVYSFDYIEKPDLGEKGNDTVNTLRFYLCPNSLRVALDSLVFADEEWKYMENWSVEIPIESDMK